LKKDTYARLLAKKKITHKRRCHY